MSQIFGLRSLLAFWMGGVAKPADPVAGFAAGTTLAPRVGVMAIRRPFAPWVCHCAIAVPAQAPQMVALVVREISLSPSVSMKGVQFPAAPRGALIAEALISQAPRIGVDGPVRSDAPRIGVGGWSIT